MAAGFTLLPEEADGALHVQVINHSNPEAYTLGVSARGINIGVASAAALPAAAQSLAQAARNHEIPALQLEDYPALQHRGIMLDPCRHPISVADTKRILQLMARYKLNRLHWHLCDDQGWRIEIRKHPSLTTIGSKRPESSSWINQKQKDGKPVEFFYSQEDIRDVVEYAHHLGITIIPEIEIPGHASAAVTAYPALGNQDSPEFSPRVETGRASSHTLWRLMPLPSCSLKMCWLRSANSFLALRISTLEAMKFPVISGNPAPQLKRS